MAAKRNEGKNNIWQVHIEFSKDFLFRFEGSALRRILSGTGVYRILCHLTEQNNAHIV